MKVCCNRNELSWQRLASIEYTLSLVGGKSENLGMFSDNFVKRMDVNTKAALVSN